MVRKKKTYASSNLPTRLAFHNSYKYGRRLWPVNESKGEYDTSPIIIIIIILSFI